MTDIVLVEPDIPHNTGAVIRLAANFGMPLHLVKPFGFRLDAQAVKRSAMDYAEIARIQQHLDWAACAAALKGRPIWALTTKAKQPLTKAQFSDDAVLVFGAESRGLSSQVLAAIGQPQWLAIPMQAGSRSINLANAVAITAYEAFRQKLERDLRQLQP